MINNRLINLLFSLRFDNCLQLYIHSGNHEELRNFGLILPLLRLYCRLLVQFIRQSYQGNDAFQKLIAFLFVFESLFHKIVVVCLEGFPQVDGVTNNRNYEEPRVVICTKQNCDPKDAAKN